MRRLLAQKMADPNLSSSAKVLLFLVTRSRKPDGFSYLTSTALAEMLGVNRNTIGDLTRELTEANLVRRVPGGKGSGARRWMVFGEVRAEQSAA